MKIFHIIDSGGVYGAEIMLMNLMHEQTQMGLQPTLVSIGLPSEQEKPVEAEAIRRGLAVLPVRMRSGPNWIGALEIIRLALDANASIFHSHGYKGNILLGLLPHFLRKLPVVTTVHGWTSLGKFSRMLLYEWIDMFSLRFVDAVVMVSENMRGDRRLRNLNRTVVDVIENGVPLNTIEEHSSRRSDIVNYASKRFTFGAIGRLSREKGFDTLLFSFAELVASGHNVQLLILGEGDQRDSLEAIIMELGLQDYVFLPGYVAEAKAYLPLLDAFILPSFTEGLPMVLLEAMVAGIPVVASRVGGVPRVLGDGNGGILFDAGDRTKLSQAMVSIIDDPISAKDRSLWSLNTVQDTYSSRVMAEKYHQVYQRVVGKTKRGKSLDAKKNSVLH